MDMEQEEGTVACTQALLLPKHWAQPCQLMPASAAWSNATAPRRKGITRKPELFLEDGWIVDITKRPPGVA